MRKPTFTLMVGTHPTYAQRGSGYTVQAGDTLFGIARHYGISVAQLATANGLTWNTWVYVGQNLVLPSLASVPPMPTPANDSVYIARPGDTLMGIAIRFNLSPGELITANGLRWNAWIYVGQRLRIPEDDGGAEEQIPVDAPDPTATPDIVPATDGVYIVQRGNTLFSIARVHGSTVAAIRAANGLASNIIYVGQKLVIPSDDGSITVPVSTPSPQHGLHGEKWIDVNLSLQTLTAYAGQTPVYTALTSTGLAGTPTVVGTYKIYAKYVSTSMSGPGYYLPNVPHVMYFFKGYGLHGAYWHNNFGTPMSHGCVNLSLADAEWFYNWAPMGTKVVTHY